jgi:hypothetical protein
MYVFGKLDKQMKNTLKGKKIQINETTFVAVAITPAGNFQVMAQTKHEGRIWKTCKCERDENNIVTTRILFSKVGVIALIKLLIDEIDNENLKQ